MTTCVEKVTEDVGSNDRKVNLSLNHEVNNPSEVETISNSDSKFVTFRVGNYIL
jgi:hypothetical protein